MQAYISSLQKDLAAKKVAQQQRLAPRTGSSGSSSNSNAPRTANAAAGLRISYAGVVAPWKVQQQQQQQQQQLQQPQWNCTSCGRAHAAWHTECFPCAKLLAGLSPKGLSPTPHSQLTLPQVVSPPSASVDTLEAEEDAALDASLDEIMEAEVLSSQVMGPVLKDLLAKLVIVPSPAPTPAVSKPLLPALKDAIATAEAEVSAVQGLSKAIKDTAQAGLDTALAALQAAKKDCKAPETHASLDKKRANVVLKCDDWLKRAQAKQECVKQECLGALEAIAGARDDLDAQETHLRAAQSQHHTAWATANDAIKASFIAESTALEQLMLTHSPSAQRGLTDAPTGASDSLSVAQAECSSVELEKIREQMVHLSQQMEQQQALHVSVVKENNTRYQEAIVKWEKHCLELTSKLKGDASMTTLSPAETEARLEKRTASLAANALPVLADGAAKGGVAGAVANAHQGANGVLA